MQDKEKQQLLQAAKMAAIGELTRGAGHAFNNVLAVVIGNLELMTEMFGDEISDDMQGMLRDALSASTRGAKLTSGLLSLRRPSGNGNSPINVNKFVGEFAELVEHTVSRNINVDMELGNCSDELQVDQSGLATAMLHLVLNAWQAMPDGGRLILRTREGEMELPVIDGDRSVITGPCIIIEVSDTGSGMSPEVVAKSTELFFTTKSSSDASGLGLSLVADFIESAAGDLQISSEPTVGTTVALCLPAQP